MSIAADENKHVSLSINEIDRLCPVAKALASPMRARMIELLSTRPMNVNELAEALSLPVSTAALNVRQLEETGLITAEIQPGIRGAMKLFRSIKPMQRASNQLVTPTCLPQISIFRITTPICSQVETADFMSATPDGFALIASHIRLHTVR